MRHVAVGLALLQPWASLITLNYKRVETRGWQTEYRGWIAVQASRAWRPEQQALLAQPFFAEALQALAGPFPLGAIIGLMHVYDIQPTSLLAGALSARERALGDYRPGRHGWRISRAIALPEPLPYRGSLGLFPLDAAASTYLAPLLPEAPPHPVYTWGYRGADPAELATLRERLGAIVVDVRFHADAGHVWRADRLRRLLGAAHYAETPAFGNPFYRGDGPLSLADPEEAVRRLAPLVRERPLLLLCACPQAHTCHRRLAASYLSAWLGTDTIHLPQRDEPAQLRLL